MIQEGSKSPYTMHIGQMKMELPATDPAMAHMLRWLCTTADQYAREALGIVDHAPRVLMPERLKIPICLYMVECLTEPIDEVTVILSHGMFLTFSPDATHITVSYPDCKDIQFTIDLRITYSDGR